MDRPTSLTARGCEHLERSVVLVVRLDRWISRVCMIRGCLLSDLHKYVVLVLLVVAQKTPPLGIIGPSYKVTVWA